VIKVGVLGAAGRMGRLVCAAVQADPELELIAAINPGHGGEEVEGVAISERIGDLANAGAEVVVDFTRPDVVMDNVRWGIEHAIHMVVGTTGIGAPELEEIVRLLDKESGGPNVVVAPNFAMGAVLMQRFAEQAARFFPAAEIVELHHEGKVDAPSGTALATARRMAAARENDWAGPSKESLGGVRGGDAEGVRVHSVRLPGLVAHQEVIFGGQGETLTIRHDSMARTSFMPGVVLAIKAVGDRPGLTVGLEPLLGFDTAQA
jgi:4-hydroxy-tetrahydrodipicolinate reductase